MKGYIVQHIMFLPKWDAPSMVQYRDFLLIFLYALFPRIECISPIQELPYIKTRDFDNRISHDSISLSFKM